MSIRMLAAVGLRFLALVLCISVLTTVIYTGALHGPAASQTLAFVAAGAFALAVVLWFAAGPLSVLFFHGLPREAVDGLRAVDLVVAGCILLGLWWLKSALCGLADLWVSAQLLSGATGQSAWASLDLGRRALAAARLTELLIGLVLLVRARQIGSWTLRTPEIDKADKSSPEAG
ncbi:hypothetical protein [Frateuria sp. YIM B11624]|uniref:hypothetical protein n=1 Tax=Frateuria sp. YIM B11624 TaxID=3143185 RepID=UPI003C713717